METSDALEVSCDEQIEVVNDPQGNTVMLVDSVIWGITFPWKTHGVFLKDVRAPLEALLYSQSDEIKFSDFEAAVTKYAHVPEFTPLLCSVLWERFETAFDGRGNWLDEEDKSLKLFRDKIPRLMDVVDISEFANRVKLHDFDLDSSGIDTMSDEELILHVASDVFSDKWMDTMDKLDMRLASMFWKSRIDAVWNEINEELSFRIRTDNAYARKKYLSIFAKAMPALRKRMKQIEFNLSHWDAAK